MTLFRHIALLCITAALLSACTASASINQPTPPAATSDTTTEDAPQDEATPEDGTALESAPDAETTAFEDGVTLAMLPDAQILTRNPFDNAILENKPCDRMYTSDMSLYDGRVNIEAQYTAAGYTFSAATEDHPGSFSYTFDAAVDPATGKNANVVTAIVAKAPDTVTERQMGTDKLLVVLGCFHP